MQTKRTAPMQALLRLRQVPFLGQMSPGSLAALANSMEDMSVRRYERHADEPDEPRQLLLPAANVQGSAVPCVGLRRLLEAAEGDTPKPPPSWSRVLCLPEYAVLSLWRDSPMEAARVLRAIAGALEDDHLPLQYPTRVTDPVDGLVDRIDHLARHPAFDHVNRATLLQWVRQCDWVDANAGDRIRPGDVKGQVVSVLAGRVTVGDRWHGPGAEIGLARALSGREVEHDILADTDATVLVYSLTGLMQLAHTDVGLMRALIAWLARTRADAQVNSGESSAPRSGPGSAISA